MCSISSFRTEIVTRGDTCPVEAKLGVHERSTLDKVETMIFNMRMSNVNRKRRKFRTFHGLSNGRMRIMEYWLLPQTVIKKFEEKKNTQNQLHCWNDARNLYRWKEEKKIVNTRVTRFSFTSWIARTSHIWNAIQRNTIYIYISLL